MDTYVPLYSQSLLCETGPPIFLSFPLSPSMAVSHARNYPLLASHYDSLGHGSCFCTQTRNTLDLIIISCILCIESATWSFFIPRCTLMKIQKKKKDLYKICLQENLGNISPNDPQAIVTAESSILYTILPVINRQDKVKAILDLGCQIVIMSKEIYNALALQYNPTIQLNMMSTNRGIDKLLGLA